MMVAALMTPMVNQTTLILASQRAATSPTDTTLLRIMNQLDQTLMGQKLLQETITRNILA